MSICRKKKFCGNGPEDISILLQLVLDKAHISDEMAFAKLVDGLEIIVGSLVKPHVQLVKLDKCTLVMKVDSSAWKSELFLQKKAIIDKCNSLLGEPFIQAIRFV